jgi:hypothetical protein
MMEMMLQEMAVPLGAKKKMDLHAFPQMKGQYVLKTWNAAMMLVVLQWMEKIKHVSILFVFQTVMGTMLMIESIIAESKVILINKIPIVMVLEMPVTLRQNFPALVLNSPILSFVLVMIPD